MFGFFKKKKVAEPIKQDRAKFETMEESVHQSYDADIAAMDSVRNTQNEMIGVIEDHEKQIQALQQTIGVKENTKNEVAYSTVGENMIISNLDNTLTTCNMLQNLPEVKERKETKEALAKLLCTFVQSEMDAKFDQSLTVLERCGMLSDEKYQKHKWAVSATKQVVTAGTYALFDIAPVAINYYQNRLRKDKWADFIVSSAVYINGQYQSNPIMEKHICAQLQSGGIANSLQEAKSIMNRKFVEYQAIGINHIPILDNKIQSQMDREMSETIAKAMVSQCALDDDQVYERAADVVSNFLRISSGQTDQILQQARQSQEYLGQLIDFSAFSFQGFFCDFIKDFQNAQSFAKYDIDADVQKRQRDKRKDVFDVMVRDVMNKKGIFLTNKGRSDIIMANAKMMERTLNPSIDFAKTLRISNRNEKVAGYLGVDYQEF